MLVLASVARVTAVTHDMEESNTDSSSYLHPPLEEAEEDVSSGCCANTATPADEREAGGTESSSYQIRRDDTGKE